MLNCNQLKLVFHPFCGICMHLRKNNQVSDNKKKLNCQHKQKSNICTINIQKKVVIIQYYYCI